MWHPNNHILYTHQLYRQIRTKIRCLTKEANWISLTNLMHWLVKGPLVLVMRVSGLHLDWDQRKNDATPQLMLVATSELYACLTSLPSFHFLPCPRCQAVCCFFEKKTWHEQRRCTLGHRWSSYVNSIQRNWGAKYWRLSLLCVAYTQPGLFLGDQIYIFPLTHPRFNPSKIPLCCLPPYPTKERNLFALL